MPTLDGPRAAHETVRDGHLCTWRSKRPNTCMRAHANAQSRMRRHAHNYTNAHACTRTQVLGRLERHLDPLKAFQQFGSGFDYTDLVTTAALATAGAPPAPAPRPAAPMGAAFPMAQVRALAHARTHVAGWVHGVAAEAPLQCTAATVHMRVPPMYVV